MQLRAERKKNLRLGITERIQVTMQRVQAMHQQVRKKEDVTLGRRLSRSEDPRR